MKCPNCTSALTKRSNDAESIWHCGHCNGTFFVLITTTPTTNPYQRLTIQEKKILKLVSAGKSNKELAVEMKLTERTIKNYLSIIFDKLNVNNRTEAAIEWQQRQKCRNIGVCWW